MNTVLNTEKKERRAQNKNNNNINMNSMISKGTMSSNSNIKI